MRMSLVLVALAASPAAAQDAQRWELSAPRVAVRLNAGLVRDVGLRLTPAGRPVRDGYLAYELGAEGRLTALAPGGIFRTAESGALRLTAAPTLAWRGGAAALAGALVRPGTEPATFTITGADGSPLFFADHQHHAVDRRARRVRLFNLDLRLAPAFARRLGQPAQAGLTVGSLEMDLAADIPPASADIAAGSCVNPEWGRPDNDVALIAVSQVQQVARGSGVVAIAPSAVLKNVGVTDVPWRAKFSAPGPPYNNDQHPYLVWNMYRVVNGAFEQLGASGLKHAFLTINSACGCPSGNILWVNCEDTYGVGTNDSSGNVGPRKEVRAHTGEWNRCGSIFDTNCDGIQNSAPPFSGPEDRRRLSVLEADLQAPGAQYYFEAWYVVRDDVNIFNTMGYRQVAPSFSTTWTFGFVSPLVAGPAIDAWVDPANPGPNADNQRVQTGEGLLTLAVRATDLGGGRWRYNYALMNHDFDRKIRSFAVPLPEGAVVTNVTFRDVDRNPATDWTATVNPGVEIAWQGPTATSGRLSALLDWGMLDSFGFEVNLPPSPVQGIEARLGVAKAPVSWIRVPILGPAAP